MIGSITVKDVARKADVSVGTVSRVFNNHSNVTQEIRERVLKAAADLGYDRTVSSETPRLTSRAIKEIGFLYYSHLENDSATSNPFWSHILGGADSEARKAQIKLTYQAIGHLAHDPQGLYEAVQEMRLGGILLVGPAEREVVLALKELHIPLVLIDNHIPGASVDSVFCDSFEGARQVVNYLIDHGHRNIAFLGGPVRPGPRPIDLIYTIERRSAGYRTALLDAGLEVNYELMEFGDLTIAGGYHACRHLLERTKGFKGFKDFRNLRDFTALFCVNDQSAIGALKALREVGLSVPDDISVVGFDDISVIEHITPALTTIHVDTTAMGALALRRLLARASDPQGICIASVLEVELVERESVRTLIR